MRFPRLAAALGMLACCVIPARAAAAMDLGEWIPGLKLTTFVGERFEYETNVFQVPSHSQGDLVFKTIPGFVADFTFGPHTISLGYRAEILRWLELTNENTVHHIGVAQLRLDFPRLLFNLRNDFTRTSDPPDTELTGRILSNTNVLAPEAEYRVTSRMSLGANYSWTHVSFDEEDVAVDLDRNEHLMGASVFWKVFPKTDVRFNYNFGLSRFRFSDDRDFTRHQFLVALRGEVTSKLSSTFRIGLEKRDPDSSFQPGYFGPIMGGDWIYRPTERTMLTLVTDRSVQESTFGDVPFYVSTSVSLALHQQIFRKLTGNVRISVGMNDYPSKQTLNGETKWRKDEFLAYGAGFEYEIQPWVMVGFEYAHTGRWSNFAPFQFQDDRFTGKIIFQF